MYSKLRGILSPIFVFVQIKAQSAWVIIITAAAVAKSLQSCPSLCDPIDGSPPGSPVPGILQGTGVGCHFLLQIIIMLVHYSLFNFLDFCHICFPYFISFPFMYLWLQALFWLRIPTPSTFSGLPWYLICPGLPF